MMHLIPYYIYKKAAMLKKKRKQCPYKPSSVFLLKIRMSVIYLVPKSPLGSSTLPSTAARRQSDEPPSICGIHELTAPRASSFGSGMPYAARTFLSHLKDASDRPEHCFRHAKVQKTFDTIARFLTFLCIISYSQGYFSLFFPVKPSF